ncbi:Ca2+ transporter [Colletotrichum tofieldiae]|nr:Ca2+ transporter [Colletotrichum tofieldiae]
MVLLAGDQFTVIKAAILGSILATMLLCLGLCFIAGGMRRDEAEFSETVSEAGSGLLLTAGVALAIPAIFSYSMAKSLTVEELDSKTLHISRIVSVLLVIAYGVFVWFQARTHHGIYDAIFEHDEQRDHDKRKDINKPKLTLTECVIALVISITLVTFMAIYLVEQIHPIVLKHGISDHFMGLILVPLVEKAAEHLTAVDEAWDNQMNFALSHVLGATLQTALLNGPLVVIVAWGLHKHMDIVFEVFDIGMLILSILTVGNFLRDQKSNYLEGFLCVIVYLAIAVAAFYYPNPQGLGEH